MLPWSRLDSLHVPGTHNVLDALAATVTALYCGISFPVIQEALDAFRGVHRRFETKAFIDGVWIIDDYAHHPTEIEATLKAAKERNVNLNYMIPSHLWPEIEAEIDWEIQNKYF